MEFAFPVLEEETLSHYFIQSLFSYLSVDGDYVQRIMLAICSSDTSIVYYKVTNDIVKPEPLETSEVRRQEWMARSAKRKHHVAESVDRFCQEQEQKPL